jgi:CRP-like cAMP-binding protein
MQTLEHIIAEHPFFENLSPKFLEVIAGCAMNVRFNAGESIYREGQEANHFYLIRQGRVALEVVAPGHGLLRIQTLSAGEVLGWSWLFPPYRWQFDARAVELTRAIAFDGACLRQKCDADHDLGYELMRRFAKIVTERMQATRLQLLDLYGAPSPSRRTS